MGELKAPKTVLEKKALKEAKEFAIRQATDEKRIERMAEIKTFVGWEREARHSRAMADEYKKALGLTKAEIDELI